MSVPFDETNQTHVSAALLRDIAKRHLYYDCKTLTQQFIELQQKGLKEAEQRDYLTCPICGCYLKPGNGAILLDQYIGTKKNVICDKKHCLEEHELEEQKAFGCHELENIPTLARNAKFAKYNLSAWYAERLAATRQDRDDKKLRGMGLL